jgi:colanic acid biosynthesis glycosyl transferase WcaI
MRIFHLGINYWPDQTGIAPFATGRCEYLAACGHEVTACAGPPYYPQWRVPEEYRGRPVSSERRNGVTILRSWMYVPRRPTSFKRILHESSFVCTSFIRLLGRKRPDLLFVTSPPLALAASAIALARLWRVPYVFHVDDLQPDAAVDLGMLADGRFIRALYGLERAAYRNAALVSTLTEAMRQRIITKGVLSEKVTLSPGWTEPELFSVTEPEAVHNGTPEAPFRVAHFGNMGVKQGLGVALKAARLSRDDAGINYLLVGDGAARPALEVKARELNLTNLRFLPLQPHDRFVEVLAQSDVCLVTQQRAVSDIVFPSKVITLLAAARPVIASVGAGSEIARVITESGAGLTVAPEDPDALADAVRQLRANPELRAQMGRAGRAYANAHWERGTVLKAVEKRLVSIAGGNAAPLTVRDAVKAD